MSTLIESLHEPTGYGWADNEPGAIEELLDLNESYRRNRWPGEFSVQPTLCVVAMLATCRSFQMRASTS